MVAFSEFFNAEAPSLLGSFFGGLVATLTPCVYPLIPITLSVVGAGKEVGRPKALLRASLYCLGIFICYTLLGIVAVISGGFFGSIWSYSLFRIVLGAVIVSYGIFSLDLIRYASESRLSNKAATLGGNSAFGAFLAGAVSGVLAAPCTGPLLATILTLAVSNPSPVVGIFLLVFYAAGFATPFFILSLSPRAFAFVPRSGRWLYGVKFFIGAVLLTLGLRYVFLNQALHLSNNLDFPFAVFYLVGAALLALFLSIGVYSYLHERKFVRLVAALLFAVTSLTVLSRCQSFLNAKIMVPETLSASFAKAAERNTLVVVDFSADWCVKCHEITRDVFDKPEVQQALADVEFSTVDLSEVSESEKELQKRYNIRGLPSILFLCPSGEELAVPRINEVLSSSQFIELLHNAENIKDSRFSSVG